MGVMMQTFFWDCPRIDNREAQWWNYIREQIPSLAKVGFTSNQATDVEARLRKYTF